MICLKKLRNNINMLNIIPQLYQYSEHYNDITLGTSIICIIFYSIIMGRK